ncbi:MAG: hypothetical protein QM800_05030 [Paludibacter sp.]
MILFNGLDYFYPNEIQFKFFGFGGVILWGVSFIVTLVKQTIKEELEIKSEYINTLHFGKIYFIEIKYYERKNYKGQDSLIIKMFDGRKLLISPQDRRNEVSNTEFYRFVEKLKNIVDMK